MHVVVWYETSRAATDAANAAMLVAEFDNRIWPMLTGLMGRTPKSDLGSKLFTETDGRLDVTLEDMPERHRRPHHAGRTGWPRIRRSTSR